ncbi:hypothetical protein [Cupriavidus necator]|uniref:hypothetical protein n=1 Tax=Cupriavidus necator TaxID=106590 RepID=UPI0007C708CE|nr:hypothetical protein [Cupriavidus necator]
MNIYRHQFVCKCPANGAMIVYALEIASSTMIHAEHIIAACAQHRSAYHEAIADGLHQALGGQQTLRAHHRGVDIETRRGEPGAQADSQKRLAYISAVHRRILESGVSVVAQIGPKTSDDDVALLVGVSV